MITLTAFRWVPPFARGLVRDLRVRWALEEAGMPYQERLIDAKTQDTPEYRALQPFGQVPAIETDGLKLFESGAILLHIAQQSDALMPTDFGARARTTTWVFAALNSLEPLIQRLAELDAFHAGEAWALAYKPIAAAAARKRLGSLNTWLGDKDYLEGRFTAGDLMMTTVLRILRDTDLLDEWPRLQAYQKRCEARPAFGKALSDQLRSFENQAAPAA